MRPKAVTIFGTDYKINYVKDVGGKKGAYAGLCYLQEKRIEIDQSLKGEQFLETLYHELFHCVIHETSCNTQINHSVEEIIVDNIAKFLINFTKQLRKRAAKKQP